MGTSSDLGYLKNRVYHAVQELYEKHAHAVGIRAVTTFLQRQCDTRLENAIQELIDEGKLVEPSPGVWLPDDAEHTDRPLRHKRLSVRKDVVRKQVSLLEHALHNKSPKALKNFVEKWCSDMEMHLV